MNHEDNRIEKPPAVDTLKAHHVFETVDRVSNDPGTTEFKGTARLLQSLWREDRELPGSEPPRPKENRGQRPLGSRINLRYARETATNFLSSNVDRAVEHRLAHAQKHQTLDAIRLYCDLLSSTPFRLRG